ncbi:MAG: tetratricopeptide repeat protein [Rhodocyclaceae bacterium]|nr:tetratricopeptide repeat protein [Rhodocyclaceae bacterium]
MAAFDLEEQEQLSSIQAWWQQHGNLVTGVLVAAAVASVGFQGWSWYRSNQSAKAGAVFAAVERSAAAGDALHAREAAGELLDKYPGTAQAGLGALLAAKVQLAAGDAKSAKAELAWAAENAVDSEVRDVARLRMAAVLVDDKAFDEALKQLEKEPGAAFAANFAESRGDVLALQGKKSEAVAAYQDALKKRAVADTGDIAEERRGKLARDILGIKLESLGGKP